MILIENCNDRNAYFSVNIYFHIYYILKVFNGKLNEFCYVKHFLICYDQADCILILYGDCSLIFHSITYQYVIALLFNYTNILRVGYLLTVHHAAT